MSDFSQVGAICTLQQLRPDALGELQEQVRQAAAVGRRIGLILPCYGPDVRLPAFAHICRELAKATWLQRIFVSVNAAEPATLDDLRRLLGSLPAAVSILQTDTGPVRKLFGRVLEGSGGDGASVGKGFNVWAAIGAAAALGDCDVLLTQDCDVASFRLEILARLAAACVLPGLPFRFAKMYYPRATDRLYGRVSRLFFSPLLRAMLRLHGGGPLLHFLAAFRYPLAGEMAIDLNLATGLALEHGWGLETGVLCDVFHAVPAEQICQVDGGNDYDHRHWPASDGATLQKCAREIAQVLLGRFAAEGIPVEDDSRSGTLAAAFALEAHGAIERSRALATMNLLPYDEPAEQALVARFREILREPHSSPRGRLPAWQTIFATQPAVRGILAAAVRESSFP